MSSSETDSEVSCPSDDSNYNFIPQYMIQDAEIQVENRHESRASDDEGSSGLAYADEPLADKILLHVSTQAFITGWPIPCWVWSIFIHHTIYVTIQTQYY